MMNPTSYLSVGGLKARVLVTFRKAMLGERSRGGERQHTVYDLEDRSDVDDAFERVRCRL